MSTTAPDGNGRNGRNGRNGMIASISNKLIGALPPAFLILALLNIGFMAMTMYVVNHNSDARNTMLQRIIENCLVKLPR